MSKVAVKGNDSGTGVFTLEAPNSNTDRTLNLPDEAGTVLTNVSDIESQVKTATNATGSAPVYACRAWVNFDGTGTVSIRNSGNVSSVTDNGAGDYTVNFATAMPSADFGVVCTAHEILSNSNGLSASLSGAYAMNVSNVRVVYVVGSSNQNFDTPIYTVAIFR